MNRKYFETIKCDDLQIYHLSYHKKRIANTIGKNIDLQEYIYPPTNDLLKCKFIYDKDDILDITYERYTNKEFKKFKIINDNNIQYSYKSIDRDDINRLFQKKEDADDIMIFKNRLLTDTSIANIAIFYNNQWLTPKKPLLKGTTRERYLEQGILDTADITIDMLQKATKIALLNAMIDFKIIKNFDIIGNIK